MQWTMCSFASVEQVMNGRGMDFGTNIYFCKITELYRAEGMQLGMFKAFFLENSIKVGTPVSSFLPNTAIEVGTDSSVLPLMLS